MQRQKPSGRLLWFKNILARGYPVTTARQRAHLWQRRSDMRLGKKAIRRVQMGQRIELRQRQLTFQRQP